MIMTISSRRIRKIYKSLDKEQIQLVLDKKIEGTHDVHHWLEKLRKLAVMDSLGDDSRKKSAELSVIFGLIATFTILLTITKPFLFFFPLGFILLFLYFLIMYLTLNKIDIGNNLRNFIVPLLEHFMEKDRIEGPVYLKMDFSNPGTGIKSGNERRKQDNVISHYWMDGNMGLTDKVIIRWKIKDTITKAGRGGQWKIKDRATVNKNLVKHELVMDFLIPKKSFYIEKKEVEVNEAGEYLTFQLKKTDTSGSLEEGMAPGIFLDTFSTGYQYLRKKEVQA
jgi:hypothetical protein